MADYIARADIEAKFGTDNVATWADLNNNENATEIAARIVASIAYAEARATAAIRGSRYALPLVFASGSELWDDICASLAGAWLYYIRWQGDEDDARENWIKTIESRANQLLGMVANGTLRLDASLSHDGPTAPMVI